MAKKHPALDDALEAFDVLDTFRSAVVAGDDAVAWSLIFGPSAELNHLVEEGFADAYLEAVDLTREDLGRRAISLTARIIGRPGDPNSLVAFGLVRPQDVGWVPTGTLGMIDGPTPAFPIALIHTDDGWKVWGAPPLEEFRSADTIALPPPAMGPVV